MERMLIGLAGIVVLGVAAQWLSWRLRLPAILFLLLTGFVAGPVAGFIDPAVLLGDLLFPVVSLSVAVILFEGGLSLDVAELREVGRVVRNLITLGVLITWVVATSLSYLLLDLGLELSVLFGAILVVTGPTVIVPLLRHIKPNARIGSAVKWEGIVNDPIGAILAVLVYEAIAAGGFEEGLSHALLGIVRAAVVGGGLGLVGAAGVVLLLRRFWIPDYLQNPFSLSVVLFVFALSNHAQSESGLLAVTVMGAALASQSLVSVQHIVEFKENLRVLLISVLFVVLAAGLPLRDPDYLSPRSWLFFAGLVLVARPLAVAVATWRTKLTWRERTFLAFMAPRGIVAAAVASLFALELGELGYAEAHRLVPLMFLVIVGTVALYGVLAPLAARWLRVASPNPQGMLFIGASPWVRAVAKALSDAGVKVLLVDTNWANVAAARQHGLHVRYANVLTERALEDIELELDGVGRLLALTPNDEVNALSTIHFGEVFDRANAYQLPPAAAPGRQRRGEIPQHLRGRYLFSPEATYGRLDERLQAGAVIKRTRLTETFGYDAFRERYGDRAIPLFALRESGGVIVFTAEGSPAPRPGHTLIALVDPTPEADGTEQPDRDAV